MPNGRCRLHGGAAPRGVGHYAFSTGRHSRYLPTRLASRYQQALSDPDLLSLRDEVALLDTRISTVVEALEAGESAEGWAEIRGLIRDRAAVAAAEQKRLVELEQYVTAEQAMTFVGALMASVRRHVDDQRALAAIASDLTRLAVHDGSRADRSSPAAG
jgi:hypothetical protein